MIYAALVRFLPDQIAQWIAAAILTLMLVATGYCLFEPQAEFRYLML